jgi:hypothetical protein
MPTLVPRYPSWSLCGMQERAREQRKISVLKQLLVKVIVFAHGFLVVSVAPSQQVLSTRWGRVISWSSCQREARSFRHTKRRFNRQNWSCAQGRHAGKRKDERAEAAWILHAADEVQTKPKLNELFENMRRVFLAKLSTPAPYPAALWCRGGSCCIGACRQGGNRPTFLWRHVEQFWNSCEKPNFLTGIDGIGEKEKNEKEKNVRTLGHKNLPKRHMWGVFHISFLGFSKLNIVLAWQFLLSASAFFFILLQINLTWTHRFSPFFLLSCK